MKFAIHETIKSMWAAAKYPAVLFSTGNTVLAFSHAEPLGIALNVGLTLAVFSSKTIEGLKRKSLGVPFSILAGVNFFTALSIEFNKAIGVGSVRLVGVLKTFDLHALAGIMGMFDLHNLLGFGTATLSAHLSAIAFLVWGIGHFLIGKHERENTITTSVQNNPQTYYGVADMVAVNASGTLNPYSFPFMVIGLIKSIFVENKQETDTKTLNILIFFRRKVTAARLYGIGYVIGALTSLHVLNFALAQTFWALAYFQFKRVV